MKIGAMNHPKEDIVKEIEWMAELGMEFVDLTLEPPGASSWKVDAKAVKRALSHHKLDVVGHTAYYLPIGSPIPELREASVTELKRCLRVFSEVGARWMNVHPDRHAPMHDRSFYIQKDLESLHELIEYGHQLGVGIMVENIPGDFNTAEQLGELLDPLPDLGLHLDIGHANLCTSYNTTEELMKAYGSRLRHVHLHDNKGGSADLHLPLGVGTVDVPRQLRALQMAGYDGTITLEVFTPDRRHLTYSRDVLRQMWHASEVLLRSA